MPRKSVQENIKGGGFGSIGNTRPALSRDKSRAINTAAGQIRKASYALDNALKEVFNYEVDLREIVETKKQLATVLERFGTK